MNLQDNDLEVNFREITCKRSVQGAAFAQGVQDFDFSVSGNHAFIPSLSYFVIQATLTTNVRTQPINLGVIPTPGGVPLAPAIPRVPYLSDELTFADHFGSCMYNNCFFRAGNSDVSTIMQYIPQASVLKSRLDKSGAWCKYVGRDLFQDDADVTRRFHKVSLDGTFHEDGLSLGQYNQRPLLQTTGVAAPLLNAGALAAYVAATGVLTFSGASAVNALVSALAPGDELILINGAGPQYKVVNVLTATTVLVTPLTTANVDQAAVQIDSCLAPADPRNGFNTRQIMFQPPLGIFSTINPISGGDFKITLNPNPNYATAGIQSVYQLQSGVDYNLTINNVLFYACQIRSNVSPSGIIPISLMEMSVLNKSLSGIANGGSQNIDFTVPPSTLAITVFVQSTKAGTNTTLPPTQFYSASNVLNNVNDANIVNNIQYIQVTYGSITKTQTLYSSAYRPLSTGLINDSGINYNVQRWLQSIQYSGIITNDGGAESHENFLDRGNYWHFDFSRDKNDTSSYVNVQLAFNSDQTVDPTDQLFIVAHYSRQAEIQYENGFITQVTSVNR